MHLKFPKPSPKAIIYEDQFLYACLASHPVTRGHVVVVWKEKVSDLKGLVKHDYELLMDTVNAVRSAILQTLKIKKVYLIYMDEVCQVHWHLVPRYNEKGYDVFYINQQKLVIFLWHRRSNII